MVQEVQKMRILGADARIAILEIDLENFRRVYPDVENFDDIFLRYFSISQLSKKAHHFDIVIATHFLSVGLLLNLQKVTIW